MRTGTEAALNQEDHKEADAAADGGLQVVTQKRAKKLCK